MLQLWTPPEGGMIFDDSGSPKNREAAMDNYMQTKVGAAWLAAEFAKRLGSLGIFSAVSIFILELEIKISAYDFIECASWSNENRAAEKLAYNNEKVYGILVPLSKMI
jgi:hypothetical protein